ncbi:hypothetical protein HK098_007887 [Nowakowskiella sp. JEL0407]|nr:hypothetical protein HK098_007887 [Nowakowskiella sp. JEL0407]
MTGTKKKQKSGDAPASDIIDAISQRSIIKLNDLLPSSHINDYSTITLFENTFDWCPIHAAAFCGDTEILALMIKYGGDIHLRDKWYSGNTLSWATFGGHLDAARELIKLGLKKNDVNNGGQTPWDLLSAINKQDQAWKDLFEFTEPEKVDVEGDVEDEEMPDARKTKKLKLNVSTPSNSKTPKKQKVVLNVSASNSRPMRNSAKKARSKNYTDEIPSEDDHEDDDDEDDDDEDNIPLLSKYSKSLQNPATAILNLKKGSKSATSKSKAKNIKANQKKKPKHLVRQALSSIGLVSNSNILTVVLPTPTPDHNNSAVTLDPKINGLGLRLLFNDDLNSQASPDGESAEKKPWKFTVAATHNGTKITSTKTTLSLVSSAASVTASLPLALLGNTSRSELSEKIWTLDATQKHHYMDFTVTIGSGGLHIFEFKIKEVLDLNVDDEGDGNDDEEEEEQSFKLFCNSLK